MSYYVYVKGKIYFDKTVDVEAIAERFRDELSFDQYACRADVLYDDGRGTKLIQMFGRMKNYDEDILFSIYRDYIDHTKRGCIEYVGEDHFTFWKHEFDEKTYEWNEQNGIVMYDNSAKHLIMKKETTRQKTIRIADGLRVIVDDDHLDFIDKDGSEFSWRRVCDFLKITGIVPQGVIDDLFRKLFAFGYLDLTEAYGGAYKVVRVEMIPPTDREES